MKRRWVRSCAPLILWIGTALFMLYDVTLDPYDPNREGTKAYGHNHEGALFQGVVLTLIELAVVYALLRPWSYDRSWRRSLVALLLALPWLACSMVMCMHAGGVVAIHLLWTATLTLAFVVLLAASAFSARRNQPAKPAR